LGSITTNCSAQAMSLSVMSSNVFEKSEVKAKTTYNTIDEMQKHKAQKARWCELLY
jgi:hypothetical protein